MEPQLTPLDLTFLYCRRSLTRCGSRLCEQKNYTFICTIMGGCRCTYKNCSLKTDGVTHLFHYPVFDKLRCHQWLTNAQKLEFLNLKVSQLKNRVVCQHHFKNDYFMNFLKDKLTHDAVPTLDGPYCDSNQLANQKSDQDVSKLYTISLEDIENEYLTFNDKKANFSVKYGDFLTNCDLMDLDSMNFTNENTQILMKEDCYEELNPIVLNDNIDCHKATANSYLNKKHTKDNVVTIQVAEVPVEYNSGIPRIETSPIVKVPQHPDQENGKVLLQHIPKEHARKKNNQVSKSITIIEEKQISDTTSVPLSHPVVLEPICPSAILTLPHKRKNLNLNLQLDKQDSTKLAGPIVVESISIKTEQSNNHENNINSMNASNVFEVVNDFKHGVHRNIDTERRTTLNKDNNLNTNRVSLQNPETHNVNITKVKKNQSLLKNKIPPERIAAIKEKRNFNMKLRDIIASCLDKLDAEDTNNCCLQEKTKNNITQKVSSYLCKQPELPSMQEYTVAYLEARMKKMEDTLLNKIDQNSRRIIELKKSIVPSVDKKVAHTQTIVSEELQKKQLYTEISKFLSPEANSLLYEELFINKYVQKNQDDSRTRKRKYR